jgi:parvulin-like peptidyl-prolyl isomerase
VWNAFIGKLADRYPVTIDSSIIETIAASGDNLYTADFLKSSDRPVIVLDKDHTITESELRKSISHAAMASAGQSIRPVLNIAVQSSIAELVLSKAVEESGYLDDPDIVKLYDASLDSALIELYLKEAVVDKIRFKKAEFDSYYSDNVEDFRESPQYSLAKILLTDEETADLVEERLKSGADFSYLARKYDTDPNNAGNKTLDVKLSTFPEPIRSDMAKLKPGDASPAFQVEGGWVIFLVKDIEPGRVKTQDEVEMEIRDVMFQKKFDEQLDKTLDLLKANSDIEYNNDTIEAYFKS